jgi:hypothetical protein
MPAANAISHGSYTGTVSSPSVRHTGKCYGATASVDITQHLDPAVTLTLTVSCSNDNGVTWKTMISGTRPGGVTINPMTGLPETLATLAGWSSPIEHGLDPLVMTTLIISNGSLVTSATATALDTIPGHGASV